DSRGTSGEDAMGGEGGSRPARHHDRRHHSDSQEYKAAFPYRLQRHCRGERISKVITYTIYIC
ncbi:MAG: hypothetical protein AAB968_03460, partial [Patescibacteria group bacterium]